MRSIRPYIAIARPSHWTKNVFVLPGVLLGFYFRPQLVDVSAAINMAVAFLAACLIASSNYVLNEILDADDDRHHPKKASRPMPSGQVRARTAYVFMACLTVCGLLCAWTVNIPFFLTCLFFWVMGLAYNVPPVRLKNQPYADVLSEAINNPIRLAMGWYSTGLVSAPPPLSVIMAYWMFGAFLMAVKRFAEYRMIGDHGKAANYRRSFGYYNEEKLIVAIMFYAAFFAMMSGIFITRYSIELVLAVPFVAFCMAYYLHLGYKPNSPVQYPELLFFQRKLMLLVSLTFCLCVLLLFLNIPVFTPLFEPRIERQVTIGPRPAGVCARTWNTLWVRINEKSFHN